MYQKVSLTLTGPQLKKLHKGHVVQLSKDQISGSKHSMLLHPETVKKIQKAKMTGKGVRMQCSPHEIEMSGNGLKDIWDWLKVNVPKAVQYVKENAPKVAKYVKENVVDTPYYQEHVRPILHEKAMSLAENAPYANLSVPAVEALAQKTGAFGVKKPRGSKTVKVVKPKAVKSKPKAVKSKKGGSFKIH